MYRRFFDLLRTSAARFPLRGRCLWLLMVTLTWAASSVQPGVAASIAREWNELALEAIRNDTPHPPAQARNLFSLSVCMYDAWAAYDTNGSVGYVYRVKHTAEDVALARREAISFAAYRILRERHAYSKTATATLAADNAKMAELGYNFNNQTRDTSTPAGVGNSIFDAVSAWFINDGSRQLAGNQFNPYPDFPTSQGGYVYINPPLATDRAGITDGFGRTVVDINHWQRLHVVDAVDQNGFPQGDIQVYLGPHWWDVRPFAMTRAAPRLAWFDPGPPPYLDGVHNEAFRSNIVEVIKKSSGLSPDDGVVIDISPGARGNSTAGTDDGTGHPVNPATGLPYEPNLVKRGDFARVVAEFWADGPKSETPPGHWSVIANEVSDHPDFVKRIGGVDPVVDDLEWDVKLYFALNAAVHDGACAAWTVKRYYDSWRPIGAIRYLGGLGQSSDPGGPSYHPDGLPIISNLIEVVTTSTVGPGDRHEGLTPGKIALHTWPGVPSNPATEYSGVRWIHADTWMPYQQTNFVTPAFPGYISGHSTFSRAAAEVLAGITGSEFFPGGMGTYLATSLAFEAGPSEPVELQWGTYYDAADEAGISRLWGGIHPPADDFNGRLVGQTVGQAVWALARKYFDGSVAETPLHIAMGRLNSSQLTVTCATVRGFYYNLQSSPSVEGPYTDVGAESVLAYGTSLVFTNEFVNSQRYFRAVGSLLP